MLFLANATGITPTEFVSGVQAWTSAITQSIPYLVIMITTIIIAYKKITAHDKALNGSLDARIDTRAESKARAVVLEHLTTNANSGHTGVTGNNPSGGTVSTGGNIPRPLA